MPIELRILLIVGATVTLLYFFFQIRNSRMQIDYAVFWSLFCILLFLMSIFPNVMVVISGILRFQSPSNMVYLIIIFVLLFKQFTITIKMSQMDEKLTSLIQHIAIYEQDHLDKDIM